MTTLPRATGRTSDIYTELAFWLLYPAACAVLVGAHRHGTLRVHRTGDQMRLDATTDPKAMERAREVCWCPCSAWIKPCPHVERCAAALEAHARAAVEERQGEVRDYGARLLKHIAPKVEAVESALGVLIQIDSWICGALAATREQAALLRECHRTMTLMLHDMHTGSPTVSRGGLGPQGLGCARPCITCSTARALLLRLPASDSEERREEPCPFCTYGVMGAPCICPKGQALPLGEK